jgi:translation initiation factor 1A
LVMPENGELFGRIVKLVGGDKIIVKTTDGKVRTNDLVLIAPWDFQSDKADINGDILQLMQTD